MGRFSLSFWAIDGHTMNGVAGSAVQAALMSAALIAQPLGRAPGRAPG
jgi:hypothetical protein